MAGMSLSQRTGWEVSGFTDTLVKKMRAFDTYGSWKKLDDTQVLSRYVKSREDRKKIDTSGTVDIQTVWQIRMFYEAVAMLTEQNIGKLCYAALDLGYEGFGRSFVIYEDYILCCDTLRNAHKFAFASIEELAAAGETKTLKACEKAAEMGII